jgi:hypothetical protein
MLKLAESQALSWCLQWFVSTQWHRSPLVVLVNSCIDGKGTGAWNQLSVLLPIFINSAIYKRGVYHFAENTVSFLYLSYDVSSC